MSLAFSLNPITGYVENGRVEEAEEFVKKATERHGDDFLNGTFYRSRLIMMCRDMFVNKEKRGQVRSSRCLENELTLSPGFT